jgi:hypothetical protein
MDRRKPRSRTQTPPPEARIVFERASAALSRGQLDEAEHGFALAATLDPQQPAIALGQAMVTAGRGRIDEAITRVRALLAGTPSFTAAQRMLADWLRDADAGEAGQWYARCALAHPQDSHSIGGALLMAAQLQRRGQVAPAIDVAPASATAPALVSVVICSHRPALLARAQASLAHAFATAAWELLLVDDARSLCEGFNRGLARSRGDIVLFCHDDIEVAGVDLAQRLHAALAVDDVVGVAGTTRMAGANWAWSGAPFAHGWVAHVRDGRTLAGAYALDGPRVGAIESLDGVFIATRREFALQIGFDAETYDGFQLYDADFCWRARRAGLRLAVRTDLPLVHASGGRFDHEWVRYARRFLARAGITEVPMAPLPGAVTAIDGSDCLPGLHAWLAYWVAQA